MTEARSDAGSTRRVVAIVLIVLASLIGFFSVFALWIKRQALETDTWTQTSSQLLENEEIRDAVADFLVAKLYANVDVEDQIAQRLPPGSRDRGPGGRRASPGGDGRGAAGPRAAQGPGGVGERQPRRARETLLLLDDELTGRVHRRRRRHARPANNPRADQQPGGDRRQPRGQAASGRRPDRDPPGRRARGGAGGDRPAAHAGLVPHRPHPRAVRGRDLHQPGPPQGDASIRGDRVHRGRDPGPVRAPDRGRRGRRRADGDGGLGGARAGDVGYRDLAARRHRPGDHRLRDRDRARRVARGALGGRDVGSPRGHPYLRQPRFAYGGW